MDLGNPLTKFDTLVLTQYPYPIAANYRKVLDAPDWRSRVERMIELYEYSIRMMALCVVSQYLIRDADRISYPPLNRLLLEKLPKATLGSWKEILFTGLRGYEGKRDLFFMKELYDLYWDASFLQPKPRSSTQDSFARMVQIRNELAHRPKPKNDASWQALGEKARLLLNDILGQLSFVTNYRLVLIVRKNSDECYYQDFTGEHPSPALHSLHSQQELRTAWFYLSNDLADFFALHPLLTFWHSPDPGMPAEHSSDAAIYDTFSKKRVNYIATVLQELVEAPESVGELIRSLYSRIEKDKRYRRETSHLTWGILQEVIGKINQQRFSEVRAKYDARLYLQREDIRNAFGDFLNSDKKAFLLLGKSGVGKSNFFISLADEFQNQDQVCFLLYNGVELDAVKSLAEMIGRDFETHINLLHPGGKPGIEDVMVEVARIPGIEEHKLVLFVDAVNENINAKALLRNIDKLVADTTPYRWFKIVLSSRPEAWKTMRRGVTLRENDYFHLMGQEDVGVELKPFSFQTELPHAAGKEQIPMGVQIKTFSREELPVVYEKYRKVYDVKTPYAEVAGKIRRLLNDPLLLRLVLKTNSGHALPSTILPGGIYQAYVDGLINDPDWRLLKTDILFLEDELMPLIVSEGSYANVITADQVNRVRLWSGQRLLEYIQNDEILSNGQRVNQSFTNLVDSEILVTRGPDTAYEIGFKYERFYDFYAGRRIYLISQQQVDRMAYFTSMILQTTQQPFLWGAVKSAIVEDAKRNGPANVLNLAHTDQPRIKEMLVNVLVDLGRDDLGKAVDILHALLPTPPRPSGLQRVFGMVRKQPASMDKADRNSKKIAVEAASDLNLARVLQDAAMYEDPEVRTTAVRYAYHLWKKEQESGFQVLEELANSAIQGLVPRLNVLESALGLTLLVFFDSPHDLSILQRLQHAWQGIIGQILGDQGSSGKLIKSVRDFLREKVISFLLNVIFQLLKGFPDYNILDYQRLDAFFHLRADEKKLYKRLTHYIDVDGNYDESQMKTDLLAALKIRNALVQGVFAMGLIAHTIHTRSAFLPFLEELFTQAQNDPVPGPYLMDVPNSLASSLEHHSGDNDVFELFVRTISACQEYYSISSHRSALATSEYPATAYMGPYLLHQHNRSGTIATAWLKVRIQSALDNKDHAFFESLLTSHLSFVGIERNRPTIALEALGLFFDQRPSEIEPCIQQFLARLRLHHPDEVDDFLEEHQVLPEFSLQVRTQEPIETIGSLIGIRLWLFFRDDVMLGPQVLRELLIRVLERAGECESIKEWVDYAMRVLINLIYGKQVLRPTG